MAPNKPQEREIENTMMQNVECVYSYFISVEFICNQIQLQVTVHLLISQSKIHACLNVTFLPVRRLSDQGSV